jgi:hypothetical protein
MVVVVGHFGIGMASLQAQDVIGNRSPDGGVEEVPETVK